MATFNSSSWSQDHHDLCFSLLNENSDGIIIINASDGKVIFGNIQACKNLAYTLEELQNLSVMDIQSILPDTISYQRHLELLKKHKRIVVEGVHKRKDGSSFPVEVSLQYIERNDGALTVAKIRDLSSTVQSESELRDSYTRLAGMVEEAQDMADIADSANNTKDEFLANMSHEMRTPLNGILGMTDLIEHSDISNEVARYAEVIKQSGNHLTNLINDILDISHIEANRVKLERRSFDIYSLFNDMLVPLKLRAQNKGLRFHADIVKTIPDCLIGDAQRLRQILFNTISNAIKFTNKGHVSLRVHIQHRRKDQLSIQFIIKDTGIGISEEIREKIFQPFIQADGSLTRRYGGSGLGLAIASRLVQLMRGTIQLDDNVTTETQNGSVFTVTIPFAISQHSPRKNSSDSNLLVNHGALKCLLAEDDPSNQLVISRMLEKLGHSVSIVDNGKSAVESFSTKNYDIILLDVQMPELTGMEVAQHIRNDSTRDSSIPILGVTALAQGTDMVSCIEAGMDKVLTKPISLRNLKSALLECLSIRSN